MFCLLVGDFIFHKIQSVSKQKNGLENIKIKKSLTKKSLTIQLLLLTIQNGTNTMCGVV